VRGMPKPAAHCPPMATITRNLLLVGLISLAAAAPKQPAAAPEKPLAATEKKATQPILDCSGQPCADCKSDCHGAGNCPTANTSEAMALAFESSNLFTPCSYYDTVHKLTICYGFNLDQTGARDIAERVAGVSAAVWAQLQVAGPSSRTSGPNCLSSAQCDTLLRYMVQVKRDDINRRFRSQTPRAPARNFSDECPTAARALIDIDYSISDFGQLTNLAAVSSAKDVCMWMKVRGACNDGWCVCASSAIAGRMVRAAVFLVPDQPPCIVSQCSHLPPAQPLTVLHTALQP
jgi:hypothetical protein